MSMQYKYVIHVLLHHRLKHVVFSEYKARVG